MKNNNSNWSKNIKPLLNSKAPRFPEKPFEGPSQVLKKGQEFPREKFQFAHVPTVIGKHHVETEDEVIIGKGAKPAALEEMPQFLEADFSGNNKFGNQNPADQIAGKHNKHVDAVAGRIQGNSVLAAPRMGRP